MWLFNSTIGRKLVMSITGACLILFVTFHVLMNSVALIWPTAYNQVCEFLGANWYALVASAGLAFLFILHIVYAFWLTLQNRKARGNSRYAVTSRPPQVEWASKNMLVLGIVVLAFLVVHLIQFWAKMQWQELRHAELSVLPQLEGGIVEPAQGTLFLQMAFSQIWTPIVYIIGFVALWFHMNHGFWSMFQSAGYNNQTWIPRLKKIACWWTTIVIALFIAQAIVFTVQSHRNYYLDNEELKNQYAEVLDEKAGELNTEINEAILNFNDELQAKFDIPEYGMPSQAVQDSLKAEVKNFIENKGVEFITNAYTLLTTYDIRCEGLPNAPKDNINELIGNFIGLTSEAENSGVKLDDKIREYYTSINQPQRYGRY